VFNKANDQSKKLQLEQRDKNIQLLASLAPKTGTSLSLLSSATLGQTPLAPTSAQERNEGREDRVVRKGIDRLRKRHGDGSDSSSEEEVRGKGKGKAREQIIDETAPIDQAAVTSANAVTKGKKKSKQGDWNPNLLPTAPGSSSSDFDSSDSDNDSAAEAGPSTVTTNAEFGSPSPAPVVLTPATAPPRQAVSSALKSVSTPGGALKATSTAGGALKSASVAGGALKKGSNGTAVAPRVEIRRKQRVVSIPFQLQMK